MTSLIADVLFEVPNLRNDWLQSCSYCEALRLLEYVCDEMGLTVPVQIVQDTENTVEYQAQHDASGKMVPTSQEGGNITNE